MAKVYPSTLKNGDIVTVDGKKYNVSHVTSESGGRTRIHSSSQGSVSVPNTTKVNKA